jgi:outer membrane receptor protein involved in Fe transport
MGFSRRPAAAVALLAAILVVRSVALAQATGSIGGTVTDQAGTPVAKAHIDIAAGAVRFSTNSDAAGRFSISNVPALTYVLTVSASGFAPLSPRSITISDGAMTSVAVQLARATTGSIATLGKITVNGKQAVSSASAPSASLDPQDLAGRGVENVADALGQQIAVTMTRPAGGAPGLPQTASLRGPDPSETLIDVDGHVVNNANTGDFDLELLDPSEFSDVQVVYGVGPSSLIGADTQGGTINFRTIDPTPQDHGLIRVTFGSFDTSGFTLQATGTADQRFGYALSLHRYYTAGFIHDDVVAFTPSPAPSTSPAPKTAELGSAISATSTLLKLRYSFGSAGGFAEATYRNTAADRDLSGPLTLFDPSMPRANQFTPFPGAASQTDSPAVGLDVSVPLGDASSGAAPASLTLRHLTEISSQSTPDVPPGYNPYLLDDRDTVTDDSAQYDRYLQDGSVSVLADIRGERLQLPPSAPFAAGSLVKSETQRSFAGLYEWHPTAHLHYTAATYVARFDTFGTSIDPRVAAVWTPTDATAFRVSWGTGFRAPLLTEKAINPNLTAEHTSEFEIGIDHRFGDSQDSPSAGIDAYRTNLRDPIFFVPNPNPTKGQFSAILNLGDVIYQGVELRTDAPLSAALTAHASYGIDIAYPINNPVLFDPSAPSVVPDQQFQGIPPHKALVAIDDKGAHGVTLSLGAAYESVDNELNRPAYWMFDADVEKQIGNTTFSLSGQNLTDRFADKYTLIGEGPAYPAFVSATQTKLAPTNAYSLPGTTISFTVTHRV